MAQFRDLKLLQKFSSADATIHNHSDLEPRLIR